VTARKSSRATGTQHHIVPTSVGGSDHEVNVVGDVRHSLHSNYHQWGSNRPPCFNVRLAVLNAVGGDYCPEPEQVENVLQITTMARWHQLYAPEAFVGVAVPGAMEKACKAAEFQITFWKEEELLIRNLLHALLNGRAFPVRTSAGSTLQTNILLSMQRKSLRGAMNRFLTEQLGRKYLWVNAMQDQTREDLSIWVDAMPNATPILDPRSGRAKHDFERVLTEQESKITAFIAEKQAEVQRLVARMLQQK